jgi:hypothetical protein
MLASVCLYTIQSPCRIDSKQNDRRQDLTRYDSGQRLWAAARLSLVERGAAWQGKCHTS